MSLGLGGTPIIPQNSRKVLCFLKLERLNKHCRLQAEL